MKKLELLSKHPWRAGWNRVRENASFWIRAGAIVLLSGTAATALTVTSVHDSWQEEELARLKGAQAELRKKLTAASVENTQLVLKLYAEVDHLRDRIAIEERRGSTLMRSVAFDQARLEALGQTLQRLEERIAISAEQLRRLPPTWGDAFEIRPFDGQSHFPVRSLPSSLSARVPDCHVRRGSVHRVKGFRFNAYGTPFYRVDCSNRRAWGWVSGLQISRYVPTPPPPTTTESEVEDEQDFINEPSTRSAAPHYEASPSALDAPAAALPTP